MEAAELAILDESNPVMDRAKIAIDYMCSKGNSKPAIKIVNKLVGEALRDASEVPPAIAEFYMKQLALMIFWVGSGDKPDFGVPWPEDFEV